MRIAIVSDFPLHCLPEFSRSKTQFRHWATWLPQLVSQFATKVDLEIHWIVLNEDLSQAKNIVFQNQSFHILPTQTSGRASGFYRRDLGRINQLLEEIEPDVVHGWGSEDVYGLAAVRSRFPSIVSMQGILSYYALKNRLPPRTYFQVLVELYILRKADLITVESSWGREVLLRRFPRNPVELVEYGVQEHVLDLDWRPELEKPVAIFVGSVTPRKGIQDAVTVFRQPEFAHCELWVVGEKEEPWAIDLEKHSPANVRWFGRRSSMETGEFMQKAWCLVLPTRADTSPNVVKEARVIGLPVISTSCGGQASYVIDQQTGFIVTPGDIDTLKECLLKLLTDLPLCRKMGDVLQSEQRYLLDPARTAERFIELYRKVVRTSYA